MSSCVHFLVLACSVFVLACGRQEYPVDDAGQLVTDQQLAPGSPKDPRVPVMQVATGLVTPAPTLLLPDLTLPDTERIQLEHQALLGDAMAALRVSQHYEFANGAHAAELRRYWALQGAISGGLPVAYYSAADLMKASGGRNTTGVLNLLSIAEKDPVLSQYPDVADKIREMRQQVTSGSATAAQP